MKLLMENWRKYVKEESVDQRQLNEVSLAGIKRGIQRGARSAMEFGEEFAGVAGLGGQRHPADWHPGDPPRARGKTGAEINKTIYDALEPLGEGEPTEEQIEDLKAVFVDHGFTQHIDRLEDFIESLEGEVFAGKDLKAVLVSFASAKAEYAEHRKKDRPGDEEYFDKNSGSSWQEYYKKKFAEPMSWDRLTSKYFDWTERTGLSQAY